jgi:hypothetical protein
MADIVPFIVTDFLFEGCRTAHLLEEKVLYGAGFRLTGHSRQHRLPIVQKLLQVGVPQPLNGHKVRNAEEGSGGLVRLVVLEHHKEGLPAGQKVPVLSRRFCEVPEFTTQRTFGHTQ